MESKTRNLETCSDTPLMCDKCALAPFPLDEVSLQRLLHRSAERPPPVPSSLQAEDASPLRSSPALSYTSADSLDSIIALVENKTPEQIEVDNLIYRLCHSLHKVALRKSSQIHHRPCGNSLSETSDGHFFNMRGHEDWCPLRHLFDPVSYYRAMGKSNLHVGCTCLAESESGLAKAAPSNPAEVSQRMACELSVTRLSGGNSNHVYRLAHESFPSKAILLRVYGRHSVEVIDRVRDVRAMQQMSKHGLCPAVLHSFIWGRVEEFMDNIYTCTTEMLLESAALLGIVYEGLYHMHSLDYKPFLPLGFGDAKSTGSPARSQPRAVDIPETAEGEPHSYYSTLFHIKALEFTCDTSFERASLRLLRLLSPYLSSSAVADWFAGEISFVRGELLRAAVPVVLSHNDLNPGNILLARRLVPPRFRGETAEDLLSTDDEVTAELSAESSALSTRYVTRKGRSKNAVELRGHLFIDFEYSDANYRCYDLGNTLCELDYDYTRGTEPGGRGFIKYLFLFPPAEKAAAWAGLGEEYPRLPELIHDAWRHAAVEVVVKKEEDRDSAASGGSSGGSGGVGVGSIALSALRRYFAARDGVAPEAVALGEAQLREVALGMLASHLHWTLWAAVMGCAPDEFADCGTDPAAFAKGSSGLDYVQYGECRLREYIALREWLRERDFL